MTGRIVVLASGSGTNCEALMQACVDGSLDAQIVGVVTNNADAGVIQRAETFSVPTVVVEHRGRDPEARRAADARLIETIASFQPDLVVLAGWMRILGAQVGAAFPIINLHPAKPGAFDGIRSIARAYEAFRAGEIDESGVMLHWVPDEGVDVGPVIVTEAVPIHDDDTLDTFEARVHEVEHRIIVQGAAAALRALSEV
ncbi:MAG: phosphoribosylglycinamide formyltransferase [Actinomycetota bacterium]